MKSISRRDFMKGMMVGGAAAASAGLLAACGSSSSSESSSTSTSSSESSSASSESSTTSSASSAGNTSGHLNIGYNSDPGTLDPFSSFSGSRYQIIPFVYGRLASWCDDWEDGGAHLDPYLAESWEELGDNTYQFKLYDGITDSEGNPFSADDVVWLLEESMERGTNTNALYCSSVEKVDDLTVNVTLNSDAVGIFETFCNGVFYCTQAAYEASDSGMSTAPIGLGPYLLDTVEMGSSYGYTRVEDYWQSEDNIVNCDQFSKADTFTCKIISETAQQIMSLQSGDIDFIQFDSVESAERFMDDGDYAVQTYSGNSATLMYINMADDSIFRNNDALRRAIFYGIDPQALVDAVYDGYGEPCVTFGANIYSDCDPSWTVEDYFGYDLDYAKAQLEESGYGSGITIRLLGTSSQSTLAETVQAYLGLVGIDVELDLVESALYESYKLDSSQWDIIFDNKGAADYLASYIRTKLSQTSYSDNIPNCCFLNDDKLQELVEACVTVGTHSLETVDAVHDYLLELCCVRGLLVPDKVFTYRTAAIGEIFLNADFKFEIGKFELA